MIVYGILKNTNKVLTSDNLGIAIDGIQLELKNDAGDEFFKDADIYLDFNSHE